MSIPKSRGARGEEVYLWTLETPGRPPTNVMRVIVNSTDFSVVDLRSDL